jgi:hypothetical protein
MEHRGRTESQKAEALAVQLCQWTKGGFREKVDYPTTITMGRAAPST